MLHAQEPLVVEADALHVAVRIAPLRAVQTRDRQIGHREIRIDAVDAASRHHRDRAIGRAPQRIEEIGHETRHDDAVGRRGEFDERAVEVEEESRIGERQGAGKSLHR